MVEHVAEESQIVLPQFLAGRRTFDLAFVDGNHRFDGIFLDLAYLGKLPRPAAVIFVGDYQLPAVARAVRSSSRTSRGASKISHLRIRFISGAVVRTSSQPDARAFDYFVDF